MGGTPVFLYSRTRGGIRILGVPHGDTAAVRRADEKFPYARLHRERPKGVVSGLSDVGNRRKQNVLLQSHRRSLHALLRAVEMGVDHLCRRFVTLIGPEIAKTNR